MWGATFTSVSVFNCFHNFNSHAPCGAQPRFCNSLLNFRYISTHTPRVGRNSNVSFKPQINVLISTHTPRVGRNDETDNSNEKIAQFQLTRPVWGATVSTALLSCVYVRFGLYSITFTLYLPSSSFM